MSTSLGRGFHAPSGKPVNSLAYELWTGRWSRMFVPMVIAAAQVAPGDRILTSPPEPERQPLSRCRPLAHRAWWSGWTSPRQC